MSKAVVACIIAVVLWLLAFTAFGMDAKKGQGGEALFKAHCAVCHPDGGNIINPQKTLHKKTLDANSIKNAKDIIGKMRNPGPGMTKFDEKTIPDSEAKQIAQYILETFK
ncbi:MAG: c-type cytochrome [Chloroflexota bacterium]